MNVSTGIVWLSEFWPHTAHGSIFWGEFDGWGNVLLHQRSVWLLTLHSTRLAMECSIEDDSCQPVDSRLRGWVPNDSTGQDHSSWNLLCQNLSKNEQSTSQLLHIRTWTMFKVIARVHLVNLSWTCFNQSLHVSRSAEQIKDYALCFHVWWTRDSYLHTPNC